MATGDDVPYRAHTRTHTHTHTCAHVRAKGSEREWEEDCTQGFHEGQALHTHTHTHTHTNEANKGGKNTN
jgi:hypothetical protein